MTTPMIEILPAGRHYKRPTPGWVVLVNGSPNHFHGPLDGVSAKSRAHAFALVALGMPKAATQTNHATHQGTTQ